MQNDLTSEAQAERRISIMDTKKRLKIMNRGCMVLSSVAGMISLGVALFSDWEFVARLYLFVAGSVLMWAVFYIRKLNQRVNREL
ncbi:MAG TPA: hypothetical protein DD454_00970 [Candidatus Moranbacteria bacterium]|nr:hypothetical protein [Candidatus Moranbacteria bacterium]